MDADPSLSADERAAFEHRLRELHQRGELEQAARAAIEAYSPEVLGLLFTLTRDEESAHECFAAFCEDFWRGLPGFRWASSLRTWCYTLARHALARQVRARRRRPTLPLSQVSELERLGLGASRSTCSFLRTGARRWIAEVRTTLSADDQLLLILRHDRGLQWNEAAQVMGVEAAALRKRYERLLARLRELYRNRD